MNIYSNLFQLTFGQNVQIVLILCVMSPNFQSIQVAKLRRHMLYSTVKVLGDCILYIASDISWVTLIKELG